MFLLERSKKLFLLFPYFVLCVAGVWTCADAGLLGVQCLPEGKHRLSCGFYDVLRGLLLKAIAR